MQLLGSAAPISIALGFCSFGGANNPVCFSYIQRQSEGEKLYTVTYFGMQKAVLSLLKANMDKDSTASSLLVLSFSSAASTSCSILTVKILLQTSCQLIRRNATSLQGGRVLVAKSLAWTRTYAATTLQVCIAFAPHHSIIDYTFVFQESQQPVIKT
jgi:hypothetical protein